MARANPKATEAAPGKGVPEPRRETWAIHLVKPYARNPRDNNDAAVKKVAASLSEFGFNQPIVVDGGGVVIVGHTRLLAAKRLGLTHVPVAIATHLSDAQAKAYRLADNRTNEESKWVDEILAGELEALQASDFDLSMTGFEASEIDKLLGIGEAGGEGGGAGSLVEKFLVAPFSVLNAREGWWQERKAAWLALGIQSEVGRGDNALGFSELVNSKMGTKEQRAATTPKARAKAKATKALEPV